LVSTLRGSAAKQVLTARLNELSTYGLLREMANDELEVYIDALIAARCLRAKPGAYPTISTTELGDRIMREQLPDATMIVDAGVGTASDAAIAMELGADGVLMNTAIAEAEDPAKMATAMKLAIEAGRLAYLAGRMSKRLYASASSPLQGVIR